MELAFGSIRGLYNFCCHVSVNGVYLHRIVVLVLQCELFPYFGRVLLLISWNLYILVDQPVLSCTAKVPSVCMISWGI